MPRAVYTDRSRIETRQKCERLRYWEYEHAEKGLELGSRVALDIGSATHAGVGQMVFRQDHFDAETLLAAGLWEARTAPEYDRLEPDDRNLVDALVRTWWFAGRDTLKGWKVLSVEREEAFDYLTHAGCDFCDGSGIKVRVDDSAELICQFGTTVRLLSRSDWIAEVIPQFHQTKAPGSERINMAYVSPTSNGEIPVLLNGLPAPPGEYIWNLKTCKRADERWKLGWQYDAQLLTELLGPEARLGRKMAGVVIQGLVKENHPLVWCWRDNRDGNVVSRYEWACAEAHENTHAKKGGWCPGGKMHRLGGFFERAPVREAVEGGQEAWFHQICETTPELLRDFVVTLGPFARRSDYEIERWCAQNLTREAELATVKSGEMLDDATLDKWFPQRTAKSNCIYPGTCPALNFCWGSADPASFEWRKPNHPAETG